MWIHAVLWLPWAALSLATIASARMKRRASRRPDAAVGMCSLMAPLGVIRTCDENRPTDPSMET